MQTWKMTWSDKHGVVHTRTADVSDPHDLRRAVYAELGVKRIVGYRIEKVA